MNKSENVKLDKLGRKIPQFDRKAAGKKAAETRRQKYGEEAIANWGAKGGSAKVDKGFAVTGDAAEAARKRKVAKRHA